jgi:hypothetical protein
MNKQDKIAKRRIKKFLAGGFDGPVKSLTNTDRYCKNCKTVHLKRVTVKNPRVPRGQHYCYEYYDKCPKCHGVFFEEAGKFYGELSIEQGK